MSSSEQCLACRKPSVSVSGQYYYLQGYFIFQANFSVDTQQGRLTLGPAGVSNSMPCDHPTSKVIITKAPLSVTAMGTQPGVCV